jgi:hypothetical protein
VLAQDTDAYDVCRLSVAIQKAEQRAEHGMPRKGAVPHYTSYRITCTLPEHGACWVGGSKRLVVRWDRAPHAAARTHAETLCDSVLLQLSSLLLSSSTNLTPGLVSSRLASSGALACVAPIQVPEP